MAALPRFGHRYALKTHAGPGGTQATRYRFNGYTAESYFRNHGHMPKRVKAYQSGNFHISNIGRGGYVKSRFGTA
jgi:hypothetical protein